MHIHTLESLARLYAMTVEDVVVILSAANIHPDGGTRVYVGPAAPRALMAAVQARAASNGKAAL